MSQSQIRVSSPARPRVLILATAFEPAIKAGGPVRALANLVDELSPEMDVIVVTPDRDLGDAEPFAELPAGGKVRRERATVIYIDTHRVLRLASLLIRLSRCGVDLVLINSVWHRPLAILPGALIALGRINARTVVLMPRGELERAALSHNEKRKHLAFLILRQVYRRSVDVVGATSASEAENARAAFDLPVVLTQDRPDVIEFGSPGIRDSPTDSKESLRILFLGRVLPHKGLLPLLRALAFARGHFAVTVAGPIEDEGYWNLCVAAVEGLRDRVTMSYIGVIDRTGISALLHEHDVLVSLTAGENFGHTIAEALQAGCPVISTINTPWTEVLNSGGGWVIVDRDDHLAVSELLTELVQLSPSDWSARRRLARSAYDRWATGQLPNIVQQAFAWRRDPVAATLHGEEMLIVKPWKRWG